MVGCGRRKGEKKNALMGLGLIGPKWPKIDNENTTNFSEKFKIAHVIGTHKLRNLNIIFESNINS